MPLELKCERCNGHIATVSYAKIRDYVQEHGEVCKNCQKLEEDLKSFYEKKKKGYEVRLNQLMEQALEDLKHEITRLAGGSDHNQG